MAASRTSASRSNWPSSWRSRSTARTATVFDALRATEYVVPALEILSSRIELEGRTIVDTISDNAATAGWSTAGVPCGRRGRSAVGLGMLYRNETIEESGVAAACSDTPRPASPGSPNKLAQHGDRLEAGEIVLAGIVHPPRCGCHRGDTVLADFRPNWGPSHADSSEPDLPRRARRGIPSPRRHLDLLRQSPLVAGDLRRRGPGLGAHRHGARRPTAWSRCWPSCTPCRPIRRRPSCACRSAMS